MQHMYVVMHPIVTHVCNKVIPNINYFVIIEHFRDGGDQVCSVLLSFLSIKIKLFFERLYGSKSNY